MRVVVTGGAGFIGSHLVERLLRDGHDVTVLDDLFTGSRRNLTFASQVGGFEFIRHDVTEPFHVECDRIYHLACPASPVHYQRNPVRTLKTAIIGTLRALELARDTGARMLISSTSEVYGDPLVHPQRETYWGHVNPVGPRACYDEGKRAAESFAVSFIQQHAVDVRIARIFNTYGPRMAAGDGRLIPNFITQALRGDDLTVAGEGLQTRSFCYVDDLVDGLVRLMEGPIGLNGLPVNLGNPDERSIISVAEEVLRLTGKGGGVRHVPLPADDPKQRRPDIGRAKTMLGWQPGVAFTVGLAETIRYFASERDGDARSAAE